MASIRPLTSAQRAEMLRQGWQTVSGRGTTALGHVFAFLSTYPPLAQGLYYLLMGLWPLVGPESYQQVTGHPGGVWLAEVIGVLLIVIGGTLCLAAYRKQGSPEVLFLAFGSAAGLVAVNIHLVSRGLSTFYLLDAVLQAVLVGFWVYGWRRDAQAAPRTCHPHRSPRRPSSFRGRSPSPPPHPRHRGCDRGAAQHLLQIDRMKVRTRARAARSGAWEGRFPSAGAGPARASGASRRGGSHE
jgi:hypothetical protein